MTADLFRSQSGDQASSVFETVSFSDTVDLKYSTRRVYVGGAGNLTVTPAGGGANVTFLAVPAGTTIQISVSRIWLTGTSATAVVALY